MKTFLTSWSGGKDSCYALMQATGLGHKPKVLLNILNENGKISRSHAIPKKVLQKQAELIQLPLETHAASWQEYEVIFIDALKKLKKQYEVDSAVFGDIDLQPHRDWEEKVCAVADLEAILPLWNRNRRELVHEMIGAGIETYIVSCNEKMGQNFLGRKITVELVEELENMGIDPCGENGEYHTLVVDMPLFKSKLQVAFGQPILHESYWFIEMHLNHAAL